MADQVKQLYYEDVKEDDRLPEVAFHLTVQRMVMAAAANRDFSPIHHNTVVARRAGAPTVFLNNTSLMALLERIVTDFIGPGARVKHLGPFRIGTFSCAGDTVHGKGQVVRKWQEGDLRLAELTVWLEHDRGISLGPCPVIVVLPSRSQTPGPLPKWW